MNLAYGLYMAEAEGYFKSHQEKMEDLVEDIKKREAAGQTSLVLNDRYLRQFKLSLDDLTEEDYKFLAKNA